MSDIKTLIGEYIGPGKKTFGDHYNCKCPHCGKNNNYVTRGVIVLLREIKLFKKSCEHCNKTILYDAFWEIKVVAKAVSGELASAVEQVQSIEGITEEGIRMAVAIYQEKFDRNHVIPQEHPDDKTSIVGKEKLAHCAYLLPWVLLMLEVGEIQPARNLLNKIQGVLWAKNLYTWSELAQHTKPPVLVTKTSEEV